MTSPAALDARPDACSVCSGALDPLGRCTKCGAVFGEAYRCPLCQAISDVESGEPPYSRCRSCGSPRVPPSESPVSDAEVALLRSARSEQLQAAAFRTGAGFALASGVVSLLVTLVVFLVTATTPFAKIAAVLASLVPFALSFFAQRRARNHARKFKEGLQQAWLLAASRLVAANGGQLGAQELARQLRVPEAQAELLLAELSVQDFIARPSDLAARVRVTELADPLEPIASEEASSASSITPGATRP
ncbi:MAG TPA: hypothetical protein VJV79_19775 [Polyangiaceae bacterium]|nr:hypothetical protein [Polyangiaceae bacterium]